ncbi:MAG: glycine--tRNA ligase subunit beta [Acidobacteriota bacterium]
MSKDFVLELGCEEIPAQMLPDAINDMEKLLEALLAESNLKYEAIRIFATPRRLAAIIINLDERQPNSEITIIGPPKDVAFLPDGNPGKAALGFAKAQNIDVKKLECTERNGRQFLTATRTKKGKKAVEILPELFQRLFLSLSFPKMMRWGDGMFRFVRPVHSLLALYGKQRVNMKLFGIKSSRYSFGHRVLGERKIEVESPGHYLKALERKMVIADHSKRKRLIHEMLLKEASRIGDELKLDEALEDEVAHMVEYPFVASGQFSKHFLELPEEIIVTTLRHHQKCFSLKREGKITNAFLAVVNNKKEKAKNILKRMEGIVEGRLRDAEFYWNEDRKVPLESRLQLLKGIQFHEKLGSYHEKVKRMAHLATVIYDLAAHCLSSEESDSKKEKDVLICYKDPSIEKAALLSKVDLTTEMVKDFPELQGIMGGIYASVEGLPGNVSKAIYEHYLPMSITDKSPSSLLGAALSISDKMDTIIGCFGIGLIPSGSKDPFALRRSAQGILKVCTDRKLHIPFDRLIEEGIRSYGDLSIKLDEDGLSSKVMEYFKERMKFFFESEGNAYDTVNAALASGCNDPYDVQLRVGALTRMRSHKDFESIAISHKRIRNIISDQEKGKIDGKLLRDADEIELYKSYRSVLEKVERFAEDKKYLEALHEIATLRGSVDSFFDHVLVMTEDTDIRRNRLSLLYSLSDLFMKIADFSVIVVSGV